VKDLKEGVITKPKKQVKEAKLPSFVNDGMKTFSNYFGHKIDIKLSGKDKGKISIPFHSEEDFNRIIKLINE